MPDIGDRLDNRFEELEPEGERWVSYPPPDPDDDVPNIKPDAEETETEENYGKGYSSSDLRAAQLANYEKQKAGGHNPIIADKNEESEEKIYKTLSRVWLPLILDHPENQTGSPQVPWTREELLEAMRTHIISIAAEYGRHRSSFTPSDGESIGEEAVLKAMQRDGGRAPFAYFAYDTIKRNIQKAQKASGIITTAVSRQGWTDKVQSAEAPIGGDPKLSVGSSIKQGTPTTTKVKCPTCGGTGGVAPDYVNPYPKIKGELRAPACGTCSGSGKLAVQDSRSPEASATPADQVAEDELLQTRRNALRRIIGLANLSERQTEILLLRFGAEGVLSPELINTNVIKQPLATARLLSAGDVILRSPPEALRLQGKIREGIWVEAEKQDQTDLFQTIWDTAFGGIEHKPFDPNLSAALQVAQLYGTELDLPRKGKRPKKKDIVWPPRHSPMEGNDRIDHLIKSLQENIANIPFNIKSSQIITNAWDKIKRRLASAIGSEELDIEPAELFMSKIPAKDPGALDPTALECVNIISDYLFEIILEEISLGIATTEDINILGRIV